MTGRENGAGGVQDWYSSAPLDPEPHVSSCGPTWDSLILDQLNSHCRTEQSYCKAISLSLPKKMAGYMQDTTTAIYGGVAALLSKQLRIGLLVPRSIIGVVYLL